MNARVVTVLLLLYFNGEVLSARDKLYRVHIKKWIDTTKKGVYSSAVAFQREAVIENDDAVTTCHSVPPLPHCGPIEARNRLLIGCCAKRELNMKLLLLRTTTMLIQRGGGSGEAKWEGIEDDGRKEELLPARVVEVTSNRSTPPSLQGHYILHDYLNSRPRYIKEEAVGDKLGRSIHLCWSGSAWEFVVVYKGRYLDDGGSIGCCLAYRKGYRLLGEGPSSWFVKSGSAWVSEPTLIVKLKGGKLRFEKIEMRQQQQQRNSALLPYSQHSGSMVGDDTAAIEEGRIFLRLWPLYCCHMLDCICNGISAPILPFFILGLGANVRQLAIIVSSFSLAQTIGSGVMSSVSDRVGRKPVLVGCLVTTAMSNILLSRSNGLVSVVCIQVATGLMGGMKALAQAAVADIAPIEFHPKFIGKLQASVGLGFVFGPMLVAALRALKPLSTRQIFRTAAILPLVGLIMAIFSFQETKDHHTKCNSIQTTVVPGLVDDGIVEKPATSPASSPTSIGVPINNAQCSPKWPVLLLVLNGFLLVCALSIETTVYATFLKDNFGYGETVLSTVFALNGIMVGILQLILVKHVVKKLGKHIMLLTGNVAMAVGMMGVGLVRRSQILHFLFFSVHILGYSIADTAIISLISRYSVPNMLGRNFGLNQASLSFAKVISPLIAGVLYERSKAQGDIPVGALAYLVGSGAPLLATVIPSLLYIRLLETKVATRGAASIKPPPPGAAVSKYE